MIDVKEYMTTECQDIYEKYLGCENYQKYLDEKYDKINRTIENLNEFAIDVPEELSNLHAETIRKMTENDLRMTKYDVELKKYLKKYHVAFEDHYGHIISYDIEAYSDAHAKEIGKSYGYNAEIFRKKKKKTVEVL